MKRLKVGFLRDDILKENEVSANRLICRGLLIIGAVFVVFMAILVIMWDTWHNDVSYDAYMTCMLGGFMLIFVNYVVCRGYNYDNRKLKYLLMASLIAVLSTISILGVYGFMLSLAIPIILSCRYYSIKFTRVTIIASFVAMTFTKIMCYFFGLYEGYLDINMIRIPEGTEIIVRDSVAKSVIETVDVNFLGYMKENIGYMLINVGFFVVISLAALNVVRYGKHVAEERRKMETETLISQIQPHFVFNTLATIGELCRSDPATAAEVTTNFTNYLRSNLNVLKDVELVSFEKEMDYVNNYVKIEKIRFEGMINLECNLEYVDFNIPPVTIQPMVENAIKYGIRGKDCPGTVKIESRMVDEWIEVTVEDDGIGFDAAKPFPSDRKHIGIHNVSTRLDRICGGTLTVESEIGKGTRVTIRIPATMTAADKNGSRK